MIAILAWIWHRQSFPGADPAQPRNVVALVPNEYLSYHLRETYFTKNSSFSGVNSTVEDAMSEKACFTYLTFEQFIIARGDFPKDTMVFVDEAHGFLQRGLHLEWDPSSLEVQLSSGICKATLYKLVLLSATFGGVDCKRHFKTYLRARFVAELSPEVDI